MGRLPFAQYVRQQRRLSALRSAQRGEVPNVPDGRGRDAPRAAWPRVLRIEELVVRKQAAQVEHRQRLESSGNEREVPVRVFRARAHAVE